jgi:hypothetical protein
MLASLGVTPLNWHDEKLIGNSQMIFQNVLLVIFWAKILVR